MIIIISVLRVALSIGLTLGKIMKKLHFGLSVVVTATLMINNGCVEENDVNMGVVDTEDVPSDSVEETESGRFVLNWIIEGGCPQEAVGLRIYYQYEGEEQTRYSDEITGCQDSGVFESRELPIGDYSGIWLVVLAQNETNDQYTIAQSDPISGMLSYDQEVVNLPTVQLPTTVGVGNITYSWSINDSNGDDLTCDEIGADRVQLSVKPYDGVELSLIHI